MDISARIRVLGGIQTGSVYYFEEEQLTSDEAHYFVVLNQSPRTEDLLILVCASSQVEKRKEVIKKLQFPPETLVFISPEEYPIFTKDTVIDCNRAFEKSPQSLVDKLEKGKLKVCADVMPDYIVDKLLKGILASTQVSAGIQKMLVPSIIEN